MTDPLYEEVEREMRVAIEKATRAWFVPLYPPDMPFDDMTPYERGLLRNVIALSVAPAVSVAVRIARRQAEAAEKEREAWKDALLNVAAVLHGDGGHWQKHPLPPANVREACIARWAKTIERCDAEAYAAEKALAEERERRGHAANCTCRPRTPDCGDGFCRVDHGPFPDPRCVPPPAAEPTPADIITNLQLDAARMAINPMFTEPARCKTCGSDDPQYRHAIWRSATATVPSGYPCDDETFHSPRKEPKPCLAHFLFRCPECHSPRKEAGE